MIALDCCSTIDDLFFVVCTITEWSVFCVFTLTKPIILCLFTIESNWPILNLELTFHMGSITEWLCPTPTATAPHIDPVGFAVILEGPFAMDVAGFWCFYGIDCLVMG